MLTSKISLTGMVVAVLVLAFACILFFSSGFVQTVLGDSTTDISNPGDLASGAGPNGAGDAVDASGQASTAVSEQVGLSWPLLLLLLFIPLTGIIMYYYGFVKSR